MTEISTTRPNAPEYVTDWRAVYSAIGVAVIMISGAVAWALHPPADAVPRAALAQNASATIPDAASNGSAAELLDNTETVAVVLPWAPLPPERPLPPEVPTPPPSEVTETAATADAERAALASRGDATDDADAVGDSEELFSPDELITELERAVTLDFNPVKATSRGEPRVARTAAPHSAGPLTREQQFAQLANQQDLTGLPILGEDQCRGSETEITELARISQRLSLASRRRVTPEASSFSLSQELGVEQNIFNFLDKSQFNSASVAPLVQMLQVDSVYVRTLLVDALSRIDGPEASRALADRAVFDLSREVRAQATESLKRRHPAEFRPQLLRAFRYPLPAVAFHAAEALVALGDTRAVPLLEELLDAPDPAAPFAADDGTLQKTELVRVNHLRNCLLCHPRSDSMQDKVRGAIPSPDQPLPRSYYSSSREAVNAEVTYLRQDFSAMQPVSDRGDWPEMQRFDFFLRTRALTDEELQASADPASAETTSHGSYPQRDAVLLAINRLDSRGS